MASGSESGWSMTSTWFTAITVSWRAGTAARKRRRCCALQQRQLAHPHWSCFRDTRRADGNAVAATTTDEAGRYELRVQPGTYLIRVKDNRRSFPGETVTISTGETLTVDFLLDIGIRCHQGHQPARCPLRTRCRWVNR